jgi:hypothetical protein
MMMRALRSWLILTVVSAAAWSARGQALPNIAERDLLIAGSSLEVVTRTQTTNVDLPVEVQTRFAGRMNDEAPVVDDLKAVGELAGPGLSEPIHLECAPGHPFVVPGLHEEGTYVLQNVRLMRGSTFVASALPSSSVIVVANVLRTSVTIRQLSIDDLRRQGITVDPRNFDVYEYTFSFFVNGKEVIIPFPVIVDPRTHEVTPVNTETPYRLPSNPGVQQPPRFTPPAVVPFDFERGAGGELPGSDELDKQAPARPRIPAALVIPNNIGVLHQFFAVALTVQNGAPSGSTIRLDDINATLRPRDASSMRIAGTKPAVAFGRPVPIRVPDSNVTFLVAQGIGNGEWSVEGLKPGTHTFDVDVTAQYRASENDPGFPLHASIPQSIVVHDPRFNIAFTHPEVVRQGITYSTYTFLTNIAAVKQTVRVRSELPACSTYVEGNVSSSICRLDEDLNAIPFCDPNVKRDVCRPPDAPEFEEVTIGAGKTKALQYKLRAGITGTVFATSGTIEGQDNVRASVSLTMGVSPSGIPLSPVTLVMPYYAQFLDPSFVSDNLQLLGLGYSIATAPVNDTTAKLPRVIKTDVFRRAVDISRAGQRIFIGEEKRDSYAHLALDLLGNGDENALVEWDQLRRSEYSGRVGGKALAEQLAQAALPAAGAFDDFLAHFGSVTAQRAPFFAALAHGDAAAGRPYALSLRGVTTNGRTDLPDDLATEDALGTRELAWADLMTLQSVDEAHTGELALLGRWNENVEVTVTPKAGASFKLDLLYPAASAAKLQHVVSGSSRSCRTAATARRTRPRRRRSSRCRSPSSASTRTCISTPTGGRSRCSSTGRWRWQTAPTSGRSSTARSRSIRERCTTAASAASTAPRRRATGGRST